MSTNEKEKLGGAGRGSLRLADKSAASEPEEQPRAALPRQFVTFTFYRARPEWRMLDAEAKERARREQLAALVPQFPVLWTAVDTAARRGIASGDDEACRLPLELQAGYGAEGRTPEFDAALDPVGAEHGSRTALRRRLVEAGLVRDRGSG